MSRIIRKVLIGLLVIFLLIALSAAIFIPYTIRRSFPRAEGEIRLEGLDAPVEVIRDDYGIPHIYASTEHDLFFAQGFVHAQDRFWQMDFWRHIGSARLAEMFGESQLENDIFLRTLGWARIAGQELALLDENSLAILQAYADGVNAYLADRGGTALSLEYLFLKVLNPDYKVEPWQPLHTLTWAKAMAWDLGGNMDQEIERAILLQTLTPEQVASISPGYPSGHPLIVPDFQLGGKPSLQLTREGEDLPLEAAVPLLTDLQARLAGLEKTLGDRAIGLGSNSWVISGKLTSSGSPILANDPHLAAQMPSIWYEVGLHCTPKGEACPYEVSGVSFAGAPGVIIGHNDRIAWGFTNLGPDVQDLYIEKVNPDNPNQYEVNGEWRDMELVHETVLVSGGEPVELTVRYTRHGPIISDTTYLPEGFGEAAGLDLPDPYAIALRWTALEPSFIFRAIWKFNQAADWEEFRAGAEEFAAPAQNLIYADIDGNIGYQMPGWIPIRASGDGTMPVPGWTDEFEWIGFIPFDELPYSVNPPQGYIVTANNTVVGEDYPYLIHVVNDHGHRARRIVDLIENAPGLIDIAYVQRMQGDNMDLNAEKLVPYLLGPPIDPALEPARQLLEDWDFQAHMDSSAAALFETFWKNLLALTFHDELPEEFWPSGDSRWFVVFADLVEQPENAWWDDRRTPQVETRDDIFNQALAAAVAELEDLQGRDPADWTWGGLHTLTLTNQTLGTSGIAQVEAIFNRGKFRTSGGSGIVNATGWDAAETYEVRSLPSMRMIVDLSDLSRALMIHTSGQSGHAYHRHYVDMADLWRNIEYLPMLWTREQVEASAEGTLRLVP